MLQAHRIDSVSFGLARGRYPRLHGKNARKGIHGYGNDIRIAVLRTDQGAEGFGLCPAGPLSDLTGLRLSDLFDPSVGVLDPRYAPFDFALHDLAGRILGLSVAQMLSPAAAPFARVYDGAIYMNDLITNEPSDAARVVQDALDDFAIGHRAFKIKIGRGHRWMAAEEGMRRDVEVTRAIQEALPGALLMVDGNDGFTPESMLEYLRRADCPLYWIEEPFRESEEDDRILRAFLDRERPHTLIADGESRPDIAQLLALGKQGLINVLQPDVAGYGFTAWRKLLPACAAAGVLASPHAWGDVLKTQYCAHLAAAYPYQIPYVESVLGTTEGIDDSAYRLENGALMLPQGPGFGLTIEWLRPEKD